MLHPCTWSFPCWLVKQMSCFVSRLSQSQGRCGFSRLHYESTKRPRAPRQMMHTPRAVSVHMDGHNRPSPWEAKGLCGCGAGAGGGETEVQGDMNQMNHPTHPFPPPSSQKKTKQPHKKNVAVEHSCTFLLLVFRPACIHPVFVDNQSSTATRLQLVPRSEFGSTLLSILYRFSLFLHRMPNPLIW